MYNYLATRITGYVIGIDNVSLFKTKRKIAINVQKRQVVKLFKGTF